MQHLRNQLFWLTVAVLGLTLEGVAVAQSVQEAALVLYVDTIRGEDGNDGKSEASPLKTLHAAQALMDRVPQEDRVILNLARGSVWRESYDYERLGRPKRYPPFCFGRPLLTVQAYGKGEKPTLSGYEPMPAERFVRHAPEKYPNVWSQRVTPPSTYWIRYHEAVGSHPGVLVGGDTPLAYVWTPLPPEKKMRDQPLEQAGIKTETDALAFVNEHAGSFYARDNGDGTVDYYVHSGSDPTRDGRTYEYKVRGAFFIADRNTWKNIRYKGLTHRDGVSGQPDQLQGVEFLYGTTHNMLISEGHFEDVLSLGARPPIEGVALSWFGNTATAFHTHGPGERGIIYDRCRAGNVGIAFFDHYANANRPAVILRDCTTEEVQTVLAHGACTERAFLVGHRHSGTGGSAVGALGSLTSGENYVEDSLFRFKERGGWHGNTKRLRVRNSVFSMAAGQRPVFVGRGVDFEYEHVTLILDFGGEEIAGSARLLTSWSSPQAKNSEEPRGTWRLKDSIIAVVNAPNMQTEPDGDGIAMRFGELPVDMRLENCVLTYIDDVPASVGEVGKDYIFASPKEVFAGDPNRGDYTTRADGPAARRDAGYRPGRSPVYRPMADRAAARLEF